MLYLNIILQEISEPNCLDSNPRLEAYTCLHFLTCTSCLLQRLNMSVPIAHRGQDNRVGRTWTHLHYSYLWSITAICRATTNEKEIKIIRRDFPLLKITRRNLNKNGKRGRDTVYSKSTTQIGTHKWQIWGQKSLWYTYLKKKESNSTIKVNTMIKSQGKRTKEKVRRKTEL